MPRPATPKKSLPATPKAKKSTPPPPNSSLVKQWGRYNDGTWANVFVVGLIIVFCPMLVIYFWSACNNYSGCLTCPLYDLFSAEDREEVLYLVQSWLPEFSPKAVQLYFYWVAFQAVLYAVLPSAIGYGQVTPSGEKLPYKVNGLFAYLISHALFIGLSYAGYMSPTIIYDNWGGLLIASNLYGYVLSVLTYIKAFVAPSHPEDRKFSGSVLYDFYMGIEMNPRIGKMFDFKLFHNGRPGIIGWTLINLSFAAAQYHIHGVVTNSMILLNFLHILYVVDFFWNEDWYLRTIDIAHDHFGWMLSWGDSVWLPFMYTLQSHYLVRNPLQLSKIAFAFVLATGLLGYYIFRNVNNQKNLVRMTDGKCKIWGYTPKLIRAKYISIDGQNHESLLLCSGWWGLSRHFNYMGDLLLSLAMCMTCGFDSLLPYFYVVYMTILLVHRIHRDDTRCRGKYGKYWDQYCKAVPYKMIPFVF